MPVVLLGRKFTRIWYGRYKQSTEWYLGGLGLTQLGISGTTLKVGRLVAATGMIITVFLGTGGGKKCKKREAKKNRDTTGRKKEDVG